jgi:hypothetical protein
MVPGDGTEVSQRCGGYTYEQGGLRGRVGNERGGKETDGCPLKGACRDIVQLGLVKANEAACCSTVHKGLGASLNCCVCHFNFNVDTERY